MICLVTLYSLMAFQKFLLLIPINWGKSVLVHFQIYCELFIVQCNHIRKFVCIFIQNLFLFCCYQQRGKSLSNSIALHLRVLVQHLCSHLCFSIYEFNFTSFQDTIFSPQKYQYEVIAQLRLFDYRQWTILRNPLNEL